MPGKRWSPTETKSLERQWRATGRVDGVRIRGRSPNSIKRKLVREGLLDPKHPPRPEWTGAEIKRLEKLVAKGLRARQICDEGLIERSYDSIAQKISRMGLLTGHRRSQRLRECRRLHGKDLEEFQTAIREHGQTRHTQWFVWKFAVGRGKVKRALRAMGREVTWKDAMQLPQTKLRFANRVGRASSEAWQRRREEMKQAMVDRLGEMTAELEANPTIGRRKAYGRRQCMSCKAEWFSTTDFYKPSYKRLPDGKRKRYLQRRCRICTSGKRGAAAQERIGERKIRQEWRGRLSEFDEALARRHPDLFREAGGRKVIRWEPFMAHIASMPAPEVIDLVAGIVATYSGSKVNRILAGLEKRCFGGEPELHVDIWELDEFARQPAPERPPISREGKLLAAGQEVAIRLYRVLRLSAYATSLV